MAELSNIAAELSKGKNVDMNLSKYADGMNSLYGRMGYVKLALNLYSFAEVYGEDTQYTQLVSDYALTHSPHIPERHQSYEIRCISPYTRSYRYVSRHRQSQTYILPIALPNASYPHQ